MSNEQRRRQRRRRRRLFQLLNPAMRSSCKRLLTMHGVQGDESTSCTEHRRPLLLPVLRTHKYVLLNTHSLLVLLRTTYAPVLRTPPSYVLRSTCDRFASCADRFLSLSLRDHTNNLFEAWTNLLRPLSMIQGSTPGADRPPRACR